jgi:hypothetical protein
MALNRHSFSGKITPLHRGDRSELDAEPLAVLAARAARAAPRTVHPEARARTPFADLRTVPINIRRQYSSTGQHKCR